MGSPNILRPSLPYTSNFFGSSAAETHGHPASTSSTHTPSKACHDLNLIAQALLQCSPLDCQLISCRLWSSTDLSLNRTIVNGPAWVTDCVFMPTARRLVATSGDRAVCFSDLVLVSVSCTPALAAARCHVYSGCLALVQHPHELQSKQEGSSCCLKVRSRLHPASYLGIWAKVQTSTTACIRLPQLATVFCKLCHRKETHQQHRSCVVASAGKPITPYK